MTDLFYPRVHANDTNYSAGPAVGSGTKLDPGAALTASGIVPGSAYMAQHMNFELNIFSRILRRTLKLATLRLRSTNLLGSGPSDTSLALGACLAATGKWLVAKAGADGTYAFTDSDTGVATVQIPGITQNLRKVINNGSKLLAIGETAAAAGEAAMSSNGGTTWTASALGGGFTSPTDVIWDGADFVVVNDSGQSRHSASGTSWSTATGGSDISDLGMGGPISLGQTTAGTVFAAGAVSAHPKFAKSTNHGLTWADSGGTIPSPTSFSNSGSLVGAGDGTLYWLGHDQAHTSANLALYVSTDGATWTLRNGAVGNGELTLATNQPRLLLCPDTGLMVAIVLEATGLFALMASFDHGISWTTPTRLDATMFATTAFAIAGGRLWATQPGPSNLVVLLATDGIGTTL